MISKAIIDILTGATTEATALAAIVDDRIYPIIDIPEQSETQLAAIYYSVVMYPVHTKNGPVAQDHILTFLTIAKGYEKSWTIALALRNALERQRGTFKNIEFRIDRVKSIEDEYEFTPVNMYGHKLIFNIRTAYY